MPIRLSAEGILPNVFQLATKAVRSIEISLRIVLARVFASTGEYGEILQCRNPRPLCSPLTIAMSRRLKFRYVD